MTQPKPDAKNGVIRGRLPYVVEDWCYDPDTHLSLWRASAAFQSLEECFEFMASSDGDMGAVATRVRHHPTHRTMDFWINPDLEPAPEIPAVIEMAVDSELKRILPKYQDVAVPRLPPGNPV